MSNAFDLSAGEWRAVSREGRLDYVVIGSGFCGLAFAHRALRNDPHARILVLEQGQFFLPDHFQSLPPPYRAALGGASEAFPWTLSARMREARAGTIRSQCGIVPSFGGRSTLWSGWCPRPTPEEMAGWPPEVVRAANRYFQDAEELLHVVPATGIAQRCTGGGRIYGALQDRLARLVAAGVREVPWATRAIPAPLAVAADEDQGGGFAKFATPGPLLRLVERQRRLAAAGRGAPLGIVTDCRVTRLLRKGSRATGIETTRGVVPLGEARVILALGTLPATALVLRSFPQVAKAGARYTGHFVSRVVARVPREDLAHEGEPGGFELGAVYVSGSDRRTGGQFHVQVTALADGDPVRNAPVSHRYAPDATATASLRQLLTSPHHVVLACAAVGEIDPGNADNWVRRGEEDGADVVLQVLEDESDLSVWSAMEEGTFQTLERVLSPQGPGRVEYWHGSDDHGSWDGRRPSVEQTRLPWAMHEASTLWIGGDDDDCAVVGLDYRPRGVDNVYVTGGALWPTAGSWNPTLTMVALAQHLADRLTEGNADLSRASRTVAVAAGAAG